MMEAVIVNTKPRRAYGAYNPRGGYGGYEWWGSDVWKAATETVQKVVETVTKPVEQVVATVVATVAPPAPTEDDWTRWCDAGGADRKYGGRKDVCRVGSLGGGALVAYLPPWTDLGIESRLLQTDLKQKPKLW